MEHPSAFAGLRRLFSSSKYLLAIVATAVVVALLYSGRLDVTAGSYVIAVIITAAMGSTALEDAAGKSNKRITPTPELVKAVGDVMGLFAPKQPVDAAPTTDSLSLNPDEMRAYISAAFSLLQNAGKLPVSGTVEIRELGALLEEHFTRDELAEHLGPAIRTHEEVVGAEMRPRPNKPLDA